MTSVSRGALGYVSHQKGFIQGHPVHMYATGKAPSLCSRVVFRAVLSLDVSTQTVFLCYMSVKYTLRGYFWFSVVSRLRTGRYVNRWNQYDFSYFSVIYMRAPVNSSTPANIYGLIKKHSNTSIGGSKCILNRFSCIILKPKAIFDHKGSHYIMGYIINWVCIFFIFL